MAKKVIVFDTNALLDIYQYTNDAIEQVIDYLDNHTDYDIYLSETVYLEFNRHFQQARSKSGDRNPIKKFKNIFMGFEDKTTNLLKDIINLKWYKGYDTSLPEELKKLIESLEFRFKNINTEIDKLYDTEDIGFTGDDIVYDFVENIYKMCNPKKLNFQEKVNLALLAEQRILMNLKPGLTDVKNKRGTEYFREYGDIFIWLDLIDLANRYDEVIFIENELKLDWWADDNYDRCADNLQYEWDDLFKATRTFKMMRLEDFLLSYGVDYIDTEYQLEISKLKTDFLKSIKDNSMFEQNQIIDKLYDYAPDEIDHLVLGLPFNYGNVDEVNVLEMLEPEVILDNIKYDYDSITRTIFAYAEVLVPYRVGLTIAFDKDSDYKYYYGEINLTYNCEFEFHIFSQRDLDILLESVSYDNKKAKVDFEGIKIDREY